MGRLIALVIVLGAGMPAIAAAEVQLSLAARNQAPEAPETGWCGETAIQEALLYHGAYLSQRRINRIGQSQNPDLYWSEIPRTLRGLGFRFQSSPERPSLTQFLTWIREQLHRERPVFAGMKIYPTAHPRWALDHMVLIVGYRGNRFDINTTWGRKERRSVRELSSMHKGLAFENRMRSYNAYSIVGLAARRPNARPVRLRVIRQSVNRLDVEATASELQAGRRYRLDRYAGPRGAFMRSRPFTARASSHSLRLQLAASSAAYFEVAPL